MPSGQLRRQLICRNSGGGHGRFPELTQFIVALAVNLLLVFRLMGRTYDAAVICAGFGGIALGSTPTAMANMTAVTQQYGASRQAFLIVPLVSAFFLDLVNAILIPGFISQLQ